MKIQSVFLILAGLITLSFFSTCTEKEITVESGVSKKLAGQRSEQISRISYHLSFNIPEDTQQEITARERLIFQLHSKKDPVILDFSGSADKIKSIIVNELDCNFTFLNAHLIIPSNYLKEGENILEIRFTAGELSLNRNPEFMYTLFVPDRASTAFPCFDQPDMKACFTLDLTVPSGWTAVANGPLKDRRITDKWIRYSFSETRAIPAYLFAFVAGKFQSISREQNGMKIHLYHRETDSLKIERNTEAIFDLVFHSIDWMEKYTGIAYPFAKYDLIAIPSFQYSGMEHTGATLYRSNRIFLDQSATQNQELSRAGLIAHETAHMWFGDLVTMKWFDEVWLKEVFAGFMAGKIIHPSYPDINHDLGFLMDHLPKAYSVDRTAGTHPVIQVLDNLKDAGTVYGDIIYHKTPVIMKQLEMLVEPELLQEALGEYLRKYQYGNAGWSDLVSIIDSKTERDMVSWSEPWIFQNSMPEIQSGMTQSTDGKTWLMLKQVDPGKKGRIWQEQLDILTGSHEDPLKTSVFLDKKSLRQEINGLSPDPEFILPNSSGMAYGYFPMDSLSIQYLMTSVDSLRDPLQRGACWINIYENFLHQRIRRSEIWKTLLSSVSSEENPLIISYILNRLEEVFWIFTNEDDRLDISGELEEILWKKITDSPQSLKYYYFDVFSRCSLGNSALDRLFELWEGSLEVTGLKLSENDRISLAFELAVREYPGYNGILDSQLQSLTNPDKISEMTFLIPALSADRSERADFFLGLKKAENREHEPWVLRALQYLHHPLRSDESIEYILPSLQILEEIQLTGDIFFPKNWLDATLGRYSGQVAADIVRDYLESEMTLPLPLRLKTLQSADLLFRSSEIKME